MAYNNNAYDLERFAPRGNAVPKKVAEKKAVIKKFPQSRNNNKLAAQKAIIFRLAIATSIVLMVCFNIYTRVEITNVKSDISSAESQIQELKSEETRLNVQIENIVSYSSLEKEAEKLGMQKRSKSQVHYIDTASNDYAEIITK